MKSVTGAARIMPLELYQHQIDVLDKLRSGTILCGGVGSGKSRTALAYYFLKVCQGQIKINGKGRYAPMKKPRNLFIITTAMKREKLGWQKEMSPFLLSTKQELNPNGTKVVVDSWNNIKKYMDEKDSFFIFDEQRLVGSGAWVKAFYKIAKPKQQNKWILLTATPGDVWSDYIPVFVANGFYKNKTDFTRQHIVYNMFTKYPKIDRYICCRKLLENRDRILIKMEYKRPTIAHDEEVIIAYNQKLYKKLVVERWNIFENKPVKTIGELCYLMRKVVNSDPSRQEALIDIYDQHKKLIVFYNFDYELDIIRALCERNKIPYSEWNGHKHEEIQTTNEWLYLVQYTAGAEAWECIETNAMIFFSQNYSYKVMVQAAGRIDRSNTSFNHLYYYHLRSNAAIDLAILKALKQKKDFNENRFMDI